MVEKNLQSLLDKIWDEERRRFNHPVIQKPIIVDKLHDCETAVFDWVEMREKIAQTFIKELEAQNIPTEKSLRSIVRHETGHWTFFPREISDRLYLLAHAHRMFGDKAEFIWPWYADVADEGFLLKSGLAGQDIIDLRLTMASLAKESASSLLNKLLVLFYATSFNEFEKPSLTKEERELYEKHSLGKKLNFDDGGKGIPYINIPLQQHVGSLYIFGHAIKDIVPDKPFCGVGSVAGISQKELDKGLSRILTEKGPWAYKLVKNFLKDKRPDFDDSFDVGDKKYEQNKQAGTEQSAFQYYDECIPLYKRWASTFGLYIMKRPLEIDITSCYRSGKKEFEIGDLLQKVDVFGSRGMIGIPGITKIHTEEEGVLPAKKLCTPHLILGIDSSGSMNSPDYPNGSFHHLAAFILGRNYHANGCCVGGWNFSVNMAVLNPSRDLESFYRLVCGMWHGGTVYNIERFKQFLATYEIEKRGICFVNDEEMKQYLAHLPDEDRKRFSDKSLRVDVSSLRKKYESVDNVLITDGFIWNDEEVLEHLRNLGEVTRTFVFLTDKAKYSEWSAKRLPNTFVYLAEQSSDLVGLALGRVKTLARETIYSQNKSG